MTISAKCPKCGKKYTLDEKSMGEKAMCVCGSVFLVTAAENMARNVSSSVPPEGYPAASPPVNNTNENAITKDALKILSFICLIMIVISALLYYREGLIASLVITFILATVFGLYIYMKIKWGKKLAKRMSLSPEQYLNYWGAKESLYTRNKFASCVLGITLLLLVVCSLMPENWLNKIWSCLDFNNHSTMLLLILILNFPVLLLLAVFTMSDWKNLRYSIPIYFLGDQFDFGNFLKKHVYDKIRERDILGCISTPVLYVWVCLIEYLVIKAVFSA